MNRNRPSEGNRVQTQPHDQSERGLRRERSVLVELAASDASEIHELRILGGVCVGPRRTALDALRERFGLFCLRTNTRRIGKDRGKTRTHDGRRDAPAQLTVLQNHEGRAVRQRSRGGRDVHRHGHRGRNRVEDLEAGDGWVGDRKRREEGRRGGCGGVGRNGHGALS